jgi:hypothetical protein
MSPYIFIWIFGALEPSFWTKSMLDQIWNLYWILNTTRARSLAVCLPATSPVWRHAWGLSRATRPAPHVARTGCCTEQRPRAPAATRQPPLLPLPRAVTRPSPFPPHPTPEPPSSPISPLFRREKPSSAPPLHPFFLPLTLHPPHSEARTRPPHLTSDHLSGFW